MSATVKALESRLETIRRAIPTQGRLEALREAKIAAHARVLEVKNRRHGEAELEEAIAERIAADEALLDAESKAQQKTEAAKIESLLTAHERIPSVAADLERLEVEHNEAHSAIAAIDEALTEQRDLLASEHEQEAKFSAAFITAAATGKPKPKRPATNTAQTENIIDELEAEREARLLTAARLRADMATARASMAHAVKEAAKLDAIKALDGIRDVLAAWQGAVQNVSGIGGDKIELADLHGLTISLERRYDARG